MHLPSIPYRAFCALVGPELAAEADRLLVQSGVSGIVLFSDDAGRQLSLVAVGAGHPCERFEDATGMAWDGLRPVCTLRVSDVREGAARLRREATLTEREAAVAAREQRVAEAEKRIAEIARTMAERDVFANRRDSSAPNA